MHYHKRTKRHRSLSPVVPHSQFTAMQIFRYIKRGPTPKEVAEAKDKWGPFWATKAHELCTRPEAPALNERYKMQTLD